MVMHEEMRRVQTKTEEQEKGFGGDAIEMRKNTSQDNDVPLQDECKARSREEAKSKKKAIMRISYQNQVSR
jgi:hypothetical protein